LKPSAIAIAGIEDASSPTGDVVAGSFVLGLSNPITA
jgi:hypothetical protein